LKSFYITTPIYYVNDVPHIGHAYTTIAADVMARWKRMEGYDVLFCTGTDEHGQKIKRTAEKMGLHPKELADRVVENFKKLWRKLDISNDDFIRTTEERHRKVVVEVFRRLMDAGDIYKGTYEGWYCVFCESFWSESQLLPGRRCPDCGREVERVSEETYFFRLSRYQDKLLKYMDEHPDCVKPESRFNEVYSFIKRGLKDISVTRTTVKWGIPFPGDPKHVIYVWFDALINYLTVAGFSRDEEKFNKYWPVVHHLVGKDIIRFHAIIWPAMLMSLGLNPPKLVFAHGWWTVEGEKMSKSKGNVVDPNEVVEKYGSDAFRYFLLREVPFGLDGDFSHEALVGRINGELADNYGNLLNRTLVMVKKYFDGVVPEPSGEEAIDREIAVLGVETFKKACAYMNDFAYDKTLREIFAFSSRLNKYIDETCPWILGREGKKERLSRVLYTLLEGLRFLTLMITPFMPKSGARAWKQLGFDGKPEEDGFSDMVWGKFPVGIRVKPDEVLFPRIELKSEKKKLEVKEEKKMVSIDEFRKMDLRIAKVISAERIPKTDKLLKLEIDLGEERRTIVAGIAEVYSPEELVGREIVVIANLEPAKIRGVISQGMLLAATDKDGKPVILRPDKEVDPGSKVT